MTNFNYDDALTAAYWWSARAHAYVLGGYDHMAYRCAMYAATAGRIALDGINLPEVAQRVDLSD